MRTQNKRLLKLAAFIERLPRRKFDLKTMTKNIKNEEDTLESLKHDCGSTACALGWCPVIFPKYFHFSTSGKPRDTISDSDIWYSCLSFFGITRDERNSLFHSSFYTRGRSGPISVANKIKRLVSEKETRF